MPKNDKRLLGIKLFLFLIITSLVFCSVDVCYPAGSSTSSTSSTDSTSSNSTTSSTSSTDSASSQSKTKPAPVSASSMSSAGTALFGGAAGSSLPSANNLIFTGATTYSLPLSVPPGRLGLTPNLTLNYNSQIGTGWLGVGWTLHLGAIQRRTTFGLDYSKNDFVYIKDGSSLDLVNFSGNEYRMKIEDGSFMRFFYNENGNGARRVVDKNGATTFSAQHLLHGRTTHMGFLSGVWTRCRIQTAII